MENDILNIIKKYFTIYINQHDKTILSYIKKLYKTNSIHSYNTVLDELQNILKAYNVLISEQVWKFIRNIYDNTKKYNDYKTYALLLTIYLINDLQFYKYIKIDTDDIPNIDIKKFNDDLLKYINDKHLIYIHNYIKTRDHDSLIDNNQLDYYMVIINDTTYIHKYDILTTLFKQNFKTIKTLVIYELPIDDINIENKKIEYNNLLYYNDYFIKYHKV